MKLFNKVSLQMEIELPIRFTCVLAEARAIYKIFSSLYIQKFIKISKIYLKYFLKISFYPTLDPLGRVFCLNIIKFWYV